MNKLNTGPLEKSIEDGKPSFVTTIPTPQAPSAQQQCHPHQETWGEDSARTPCGCGCVMKISGKTWKISPEMGCCPAWRLQKFSSGM